MADTNVRTYDPKQVKIVFGAVNLSGFPEGTFVNIAWNGDDFEKFKGADGGVDRVNKNVYDAAVTITLKQTSPVNALLSALVIADKASNTGKLPLVITDLNGTTLFAAEQAWIGKRTDVEFGDSMANREWRFDTGIAEAVIGGNN